MGVSGKRQRKAVTASCVASSFTNKNRRTDSGFESEHEMQDYSTDLQDNEQESQRWYDSESEASEEEWIMDRKKHCQAPILGHIL